jgi:hypothetical protein
MKKCTYCGKRYPDEATVCETDANPLVPIKVATVAPPLTADMTWLDRYFVGKSDGFLGSIKLALPLSIIGIAACKHPTARKNALINFGWHMVAVGLALIILIILKLAGR